MIIDWNKVREFKSLHSTCEAGFKEFRRTGITPPAAYHAMRALFVRTNGIYNDVWQSIYSLKNPPSAGLGLASTLFDDLSPELIKTAVQEIKDHGYHVFPKLIPAQITDALTDFAIRTPAYLQSDGYYSKAPEAKFEPNNLLATNYRFDETHVANEIATQRVLGDPIVLETSRQFFKSAFHINTVELWWTTPFKCNTPSSTLAQQYHFDLDRFSFLNFFVYLTDVGTEDGPHCFVKDSHRNKPKACLVDRRLSDEEVADNFPVSQRLELCGPKGTLLIVDGKGFHKAKMPTSGNRLILTLNTCSSLFGQNYSAPMIKIRDDKLLSAYNATPALFDRFNISDGRVSQPDSQVLVGAGSRKYD